MAEKENTPAKENKEATKAVTKKVDAPEGVPSKGKKAAKKETNVSKLKDLKIELLKNPTKRKRIKREIARILTEQSMKTKVGGNQ
ncbi:hypothetical protein HN747_04195 [archaeon]|jgi:ribosomal protein L29|nr:hypothetical protein [archaeon]